MNYENYSYLRKVSFKRLGQSSTTERTVRWIQFTTLMTNHFFFGATFLTEPDLGAGFFAPSFLAPSFFFGVFFAAGLLATDFLAAVFLAADFLAAFLAAFLADDGALDFEAAAALAGALLAAAFLADFGVDAAAFFPAAFLALDGVFFASPALLLSSSPDRTILKVLAWPFLATILPAATAR